MRAKKLLPLLMAAVLGVSALSGCGNSIDADETGATLDGQEISLGFMNFMARYQQAIYDGNFSSMFGQDQDIWGQNFFEEDVDSETSVKNSVADSIEEYYLLEKHMSDYKVEITDEELSAMDAAAEQFMKDNTKSAIQQLGATKEYVKEMLRLTTIQSKMRNAIQAEVDTEVSDEEAAQKKISYVQVASQSTTDEEGNKVDYTDEEKADIKQKVETFQKSAADDFEGAAETAGYTVSNATFGDNDESYTLDDSVIEAAKKLKEGEISEVIATDDNYYVVRMDSLFDKEATETKKDSIVTDRKNDHYTEVCDKYKEGVKYEINEEEWAKVKFDELFSIKAAEEEEAADDAQAENASDDAQVEGASDDAQAENAADDAQADGTSDDAQTEEGSDKEE